MVDIIKEYSPMMLTEEQISAMKRICGSLIEKNKVMNLTSLKDSSEIEERHFLDSLYPLETTFVRGKVLDVGSGGGFPAFPVAVASGLDVTCLDATQKKLDFIKETAADCGVGNISVLCGRAEELSLKAQYRERFDTVLSRGVAKLNVLCEWCLPYVRVNGYFIAMKGESGEAEAEEAMNAIEKLGGRLVYITQYQLPICNHRHTLVIINKQSHTPKEYPRHNSRITKNPL